MRPQSTITNAPVAEALETSERRFGIQAQPLWRTGRLNIALFLFFNLFINYMDRSALSMAAPVIADRFKWQPGTMGLLFSSFMWTYSLFLIPWGALSDRIGTRTVNGISVSIWSLAAMLTSVSVGFRSMLATRLALGVGESASLPTAAKVVRQWFPASERGLATAIFNSGTFAGPAVSTPFIAWLIARTGWRMSFAITGAVGLVWVALWLMFFDLPSECAWLSDSERRYLLSENTTITVPPRGVRATLHNLLSRKTMWGLCLSQGCCAYVMSVFLFWLPSYLTAARNMSLMKASWYTSLPYVVASVLGVAIGHISDNMLTSDAARNGKRRFMVIVTMFLSMTIVLIDRATTNVVAILLISIALTSISGALSLNIALANDLVWDPEIAGTALGILILGGITGSLLAPIVTGYIVQITRSFDDAFVFAGFLLVIGIIASLVLTREPLSFPAIKAVL